MLKVIAFALGLIMATSTFAADLGKPAPVVPAALSIPAPAADSWTGFYFEAGVGTRFIDADKRTTVGKAGIGYDWRLPDSKWVIGPLLRYGFRIDGDLDVATFTFDEGPTVAGRLGFIALPNTLVYGIGGYKFGDSLDRGFLVGLGAEVPILGRLRLGIEYTAQMEDFKADRDVIHEVILLGKIPF